MDFQPTRDRDESHHHDPYKEDKSHELTSFLSLNWVRTRLHGRVFQFEALGCFAPERQPRTPETQK